MAESAPLRLDSWKEIAGYLKSSVRTVQRWERYEQLPVHRHGHARQDTVYAYADELEGWRAARDRRRPSTDASLSAQIAELRTHLAGAAHPPRLTLARHCQGPILVRSAEIRTLHEHLLAALAGDARVVCLTGEPGVGKTTLIDQFAAGLDAVSPRPVVTFSACSQRLGSAEAFLPILDSLDQLTRAGDDAPLSRLLQLAAPTWYVQVAPLWSTSDAAFASVMERARAASPERLKRELFAFVAHITDVLPLVVVIDDLHWADPSTIEVLAYLLTRPELKRLLVLCAYRETDMSLSSHPFLPIKQELLKRRICAEVPMRLLDMHDTTRYLTLAFPDHRFPPELADLIFRRTGGNPLFLSEITRDLAARGSVQQRDGHWLAESPVDQIGRWLPVSVQSIIQRKIDQLDEADRLLITAASVQGVEFDSQLAAVASRCSPADAEQRLLRLEHVHMMVTRLDDREPDEGLPVQRYAFVHVLYQEALYGSLTPSRRAELSLLVAEALAQRNPDTPSRVAADLALLYEAGREFEQAARWFLEASRHAASVYANRAAVDLARRATACAARLPDVLRSTLEVEAAMLQAELHLTLSAFEDAIADFGLAERAAADAGAMDTQIEAICGAALALFNLKRTGETRALGSKALELAGRSGEETGVASAQIVLAMERMCCGDLDGAETLSTPSLPVLQTRFQHPIPLHVIEGVGYGAALHGWRLEYEQALPPCEWALERARERGSAFHIVCLLFIRGLGLGNFGRLSDALADLHEGLRLSESNQERYWLPRLPNTLAWLHGEMFDLEHALRLNQEGSRIAREMNFPEGDANSQINLALNYLSLGEPQSAGEHLAAAEALLAEDEWFRWVYRIRLEAAYAQYWLTKGDVRRAARFATASLHLANSTRRRKHTAWARKLLGDIAAVEDQLPEAVRWYEQGLADLQRHPCPSVEWKIMAALAGTHARLHHHDDAHQWRAAARGVTDRLSDAIREHELQARFRNAQPVRDLKTPSR
jgi:tetratricopeptide (TPR) repeat protein